MGYTPFGYRIENGIAIIDEPAAAKLRLLYKNYLSGMSLSKAAAGIPTYHGTAKRLMKLSIILATVSTQPSLIRKPTRKHKKNVNAEPQNSDEIISKHR